MLPGGAVANAAEMGTLAAAAAERRPWVTPRPDQWVYQRTRNADGFDMNRSWEGVEPARTNDVPSRTNDVPSWTRVDGKAVADVRSGGVLVVHEQEHGTQTGGPMFGVWNSTPCRRSTASSCAGTSRTRSGAVSSAVVASRIVDRAGDTG